MSRLPLPVLCRYLLAELNENESDAKLKKKNENTNECIRNFYFSLLFSLLPIIFSLFFPDVFLYGRENLQKRVSALYLCIV